jgi:hypothetical protein
MVAGEDWCEVAPAVFLNCHDMRVLEAEEFSKLRDSVGGVPSIPGTKCEEVGCREGLDVSFDAARVQFWISEVGEKWNCKGVQHRLAGVANERRGVGRGPVLGIVGAMFVELRREAWGQVVSQEGLAKNFLGRGFVGLRDCSRVGTSRGCRARGPSRRGATRRTPAR